MIRSLRINFDGGVSIIENSKTRNALICDAYINNEYTLKKISDCLKIHYSTVSKIVKGVRIQNSRPRTMQLRREKTMEILKKKLNVKC